MVGHAAGQASGPHLDAELVPFNEKARYLTVIRDPKEVVVSSYFFLGGLFGVLSHMTVGEWCDVFLSSDSMAHRWASHTASYWNWCNRPNALVLTYGELKREPRAWIERVTQCMGVELTEPQLDEVERRSSFEYMKAHEPQFAPPHAPFAKDENATQIFRSGKAGASHEQLSCSQQAAVDRRCQEELKKLDSDFPYAEAFDVVHDD